MNYTAANQSEPPINKNDIADAANNKVPDFIRRGGAVTLTQAGRGKFLRAYERRMDEEISHPIFGYRISYRRTLEVQIRLLARFLTGEIDEYPPFATR